MKLPTIMRAAALLAPLALIIGCGKDVAVDPPKPKPTDSITVSVTPTSGTLDVGQTMQFNATLTGGNSTNIGWVLNSAAPDYGTISPSGVYTAPLSIIGDSIIVTVTAMSTQNSKARASASVVVRRLRPVVPGAGSSYSYAYYDLDSSARKIAGSDRNITHTVSRSGISWHDRNDVVSITADGKDSYIGYDANGDLMGWSEEGGWGRYPFGSRATTRLAAITRTLPNGAQYSDSSTATYLGAEMMTVGGTSLVVYKIRINRVERSGIPGPYTINHTGNYWYAPAIGWYVKWDTMSVYTDMESRRVSGGAASLTSYELK